MARKPNELVNLSLYIMHIYDDLDKKGKGREPFICVATTAVCCGGKELLIY